MYKSKKKIHFICEKFSALLTFNNRKKMKWLQIKIKVKRTFPTVSTARRFSRQKNTVYNRKKKNFRELQIINLSENKLTFKLLIYQCCGSNQNKIRIRAQHIGLNFINKNLIFSS